MDLPDGTYRIRNYLSKSHVVLRHVGDNMVACNGQFAEGDTWHVDCRINEEDNSKYQIQNYDETYSATCDPKVREEGNLCARKNVKGVPVPVWLIKREDKGKPVSDPSVTYTISKDDYYWTFKTDEPNAEVVVRHGPPNSSNWWIFERVEPSYHFLPNVPCKYVPSEAVGGTGQMTLDPRQYTFTRDERELLKGLMPVSKASYDPARVCMEGTRTKILKDLYDWATNIASSESMLWLHGLAGAGKSSIAASIAHRLSQENTLGASFFCKRDDPDCRDPSRLILTIVHSLADIWKPFGKELAAALLDKPDFASASILQLKNDFIVKSLDKISHLQMNTPFVIVVDALDECGSDMSRNQVLDCLYQASQSCRMLRVIVTSRPYTDISNWFTTSQLSDCITWPLISNDEITHEDILTFTKKCFAGLVAHTVYVKNVNQTMEKLAQHYDVEGALKILLSGESPDEAMDQLYKLS